MAGNRISGLQTSDFAKNNFPVWKRRIIWRISLSSPLLKSEKFEMRCDQNREVLVTAMSWSWINRNECVRNNAHEAWAWPRSMKVSVARHGRLSGRTPVQPATLPGLIFFYHCNQGLSGEILGKKKRPNWKTASQSGRQCLTNNDKVSSARDLS